MPDLSIFSFATLANMYREAVKAYADNHDDWKAAVDLFTQINNYMFENHELRWKSQLRAWGYPS